MSEPSLFDHLLECGCRPNVQEVCDLCQVIKPEVERLRAKLQVAEEAVFLQSDTITKLINRAEAAEAEVARLDPAYVNGLQARFADQSARVAELEAVLAEVVRISDRKHDAWDRAHALLDGRGE